MVLLRPALLGIASVGGVLLSDGYQMADPVPRTMWPLAEFSNQGDHAEVIEFSLSLIPSVPSGCSRTTQLVLPGQESRYSFPGERAYAVYRTLYECHAPASPPGFEQFAQFSVVHPGGGEPQDAHENNNAATDKFAIIQ